MFTKLIWSLFNSVCDSNNDIAFLNLYSAVCELCCNKT